MPYNSSYDCVSFLIPEFRRASPPVHLATAGIDYLQRWWANDADVTCDTYCSIIRGARGVYLVSLGLSIELSQTRDIRRVDTNFLPIKYGVLHEHCCCCGVLGRHHDPQPPSVPVHESPCSPPVHSSVLIILPLFLPSQTVFLSLCL